MFYLWETYFLFDDEKSISQYLATTPDEYFKFMDLLFIYDIVYGMIRGLKPFAIENFIRLYIFTDYINAENIRLDHTTKYMMSFASRNEIPVKSLIDIHTYYNYSYNIPLEYQIASLLALPEQNVLLHEQIKKLYGYAYNDLNIMYRYFKICIESIYHDYTAGLITSNHFKYFTHRKNAENNLSIMITNEIARLMRETYEPTTFFISVGIERMLGNYSIINLLIEDGFEVIPLYE